MAEIILKGLTDEELELELGKLTEKRIKGRFKTILTTNDLYPKFIEVEDGKYDTIFSIEQLIDVEELQANTQNYENIITAGELEGDENVIENLNVFKYDLSNIVYEADELRYSPDSPYLVVTTENNEKKVFFFERNDLEDTKFVENQNKTGIFWDNQALIFRDDNENYALIGPFLLMNDTNVTFGSTEFDFTD